MSGRPALACWGICLALIAVSGCARPVDGTAQAAAATPTKPTELAVSEPGQPDPTCCEDPSRPDAQAAVTKPAAAAKKEDEDQGFRVRSVIPVPEKFVGNVAYDRKSGRLWLISLGPPANIFGPSILYEVAPDSGKVLRQKEMPFLGEFGTPVYLDGHLYQGVHHESKLYKIAVDEPSKFGTIVAELPLPAAKDLPPREGFVSRFPFIPFTGATDTPDGKLLIHAELSGDLISIDPKTGGMLGHARTVRCLGGIARVPGPKGEFLVIGNADVMNSQLKIEMAEFMFRGKHGIVPISNDPLTLNCMRPEPMTIHWVLVDGKSGATLASTRLEYSRTYGKSIAFMSHAAVEGTPYGRYTLLATGHEGLLVLDWTPRAD